MAERKERNGQLFSFGAMIEKKYKMASPEQKEVLRKEAAELLDDRNRDRAMAGFDRLDVAQGEAGGQDPPRGQEWRLSFYPLS